VLMNTNNKMSLWRLYELSKGNEFIHMQEAQK
jgi:hypothetical protein